MVWNINFSWVVMLHFKLIFCRILKLFQYQVSICILFPWKTYELIGYYERLLSFNRVRRSAKLNSHQRHRGAEKKEKKKKMKRILERWSGKAQRKKVSINSIIRSYLGTFRSCNHSRNIWDFFMFKHSPCSPQVEWM